MQPQPRAAAFFSTHTATSLLLPTASSTSRYFPLPPLLPVASHPHQPPIAHAVIILPYHNPCCCSLLLLPPLLLLQPHLASSFVITAIAPICRLQPHPVAPSFASCSPTQ
ncbi:hypothetical protein BHM03_00040020 [Ensete ventricosum]|nr:hypothetical protein BHM03_00040020 [Ensete ventricosum]